MTKMPYMRTAIVLTGIITFAMQGCAASAPSPQQSVQTASLPVPPAPTVEQTASVSPPQDSVSPEIAALRQAVKQRNTSEIESTARQIIDRNSETPEAAEALRALAELSRTQKLYREAMLYIDAAEKADQDNPDTMLLHARIAHEDSRDDAAVSILNKMNEMGIKSVDANILRASVLLEYLDTARAFEAAKAAAEMAPQRCDAAAVYAAALYAEKKFEEAVAQYEIAQKLCPLDENSLKNLAKLYEVKVPDAAKSCEAYRKLTEMNPNSAYYKASRDYQCSLNGSK